MASLIRWARLPMIFLSALCALALSVGGAFAASPTTNEHLKTNDDIQRAMRARQVQLQGASSQITAENAYAAWLVATIASLQQQGKNVTDLNNGLTRFRGQIATSQGALQNIDNLLAVHSGFDAQGNVVDKGLARSTVDGMHSNLLLIKRTASNAKNDLNDLLHRWGKTYGVPFGSRAADDAF